MKEKRKRILVEVVNWRHGVNGLLLNLPPKLFFLSIFFFKSSHRVKYTSIGSVWWNYEVELHIKNLEQEQWHHDNVIAFEVRERYPLFLLRVLCLIGCPVQIIREVILRLHLRRRWHKFASLWSACLRFVSLWRVNSRGVSCVLKGLLRSDILSSY